MVDRKPDYYVKKRVVDHPVHHLIHNRWSPVVFSDAPVEEEKLLSLFEAARWAPSCYNEQPWTFVIGVKGEEGHEKILSCLVEKNQEWAKDAPVLGLSVAREYFERNDKPNREYMHDVGLAMGQLCIQAVDLELSVHQMAGFRKDQAQEVLGIPDRHQPCAAFAIGYMANPKDGPDPLRERDETIGTRKPLKDFLFRNSWG